MQHQADRRAGLQAKEMLTNLSTASAPWTAPWVYQYTADNTDSTDTYNSQSNKALISPED